MGLFQDQAKIKWIKPWPIEVNLAKYSKNFSFLLHFGYNENRTIVRQTIGKRIQHLGLIKVMPIISGIRRNDFSL